MLEENSVATISHNEYKDGLLIKNFIRHTMNRIQNKDHRFWYCFFSLLSPPKNFTDILSSFYLLNGFIMNTCAVNDAT